MAQQTPPFVIQASSHSAELFRRAIGTLLSSGGGVVGSGDYLVTQNGTPNMSVNVAAGQIWIPGTSSTAQAQYYAYNDGTVNLAIAAANPSNPRIDTVIVQVQDAAYAGAVNSVTLSVLTGTPAASPVAPTLPASTYALANIAVAAAAGSVLTANITDRRARYATAASILFSAVDTAESTSSASFVNLTTVGPTLTIGLAGDYIIEWGANILASGTNDLATVGLSVNAAAPLSTDKLQVGLDITTNLYAGAATKRLKTALAAGTTLQAKYMTTAGAATFYSRYLSATRIN